MLAQQQEVSFPKNYRLVKEHGLDCLTCVIAALFSIEHDLIKVTNLEAGIGHLKTGFLKQNGLLRYLLSELTTVEPCSSSKLVV